MNKHDELDPDDGLWRPGRRSFFLFGLAAGIGALLPGEATRETIQAAVAPVECASEFSIATLFCVNEAQLKIVQAVHGPKCQCCTLEEWKRVTTKLADGRLDGHLDRIFKS